MPLAGQSSSEFFGERPSVAAPATASPIVETPRERAIYVKRDPFEAEEPRQGNAAAAGTRAVQGQPMPAAGPLVTAVVLGPSARALVDDGMRVRIVQPGDALAGSVVRSIDAAGVHLATGAILPLAENMR